MRPTLLAAFALAKRWLEQSKALAVQGTLLSSPRIIVDDDWTSGAHGAQPPHVYICLADSVESFVPFDMRALGSSQRRGIQCWTRS